MFLRVLCSDCFPFNGSVLFIATADLFTDCFSQDRIASVLRFFGHGGNQGKWDIDNGISPSRSHGSMTWEKLWKK